MASFIFSIGKSTSSSCACACLRACVRACGACVSVNGCVRLWACVSVDVFVVLFLTKANQVKGLFRASKGGTCGTVVDAKIVFAAAVKAMAAAIIVAHNHPSGNLQPSQADVELTRKLKQAGEALELPVLDHLILAPYIGYYSFADEGAI